MNAPTLDRVSEQLRNKFELAYATAWASSAPRTETVSRLAEVVKAWRDGDTYPMDLPRLRFGWEAYQWAAFRGSDGFMEQEAELLEQGASMLEALAGDERNRGNDSAAMGAECSAHAVRRLAVALQTQGVALVGELLEIAAEQRDAEQRGCSYGPEEIAQACELAAWHLNTQPKTEGGAA